jgi:hypothetical protein
MVGQRYRVLNRISLLCIGLVGLAGLRLLALGLMDQWLRYNDWLAAGLGFKDRACAISFCDYSVFWAAGRLARDGATTAIYDRDQFFHALGQVVSLHTTSLPFQYPPITLIPVALITMTGLAAGYYLYFAVSLGLTVLLLWRAGLGWRFILIGLISVPETWNLYLGQFGGVCSALLIYGLMMAGRRPLAGGVALGFLAIKPQYALLVPVVVLASRNVKALLAGGVVLCVLVATSVIWFGWSSWLNFLGPGRATMRDMLQQPFGPGYETLGISVFWMARSFGASVAVSYVVQAVVAAAAVLGTWRLWRVPAADPMGRVAVTVFLTLLASPYGYTDDLVAYSIALPMLCRWDKPLANVVLTCLWLAPAYAQDFTVKFGFLPMPFCIAAAAVIGWRQVFGGDVVRVNFEADWIASLRRLPRFARRRSSL